MIELNPKQIAEGKFVLLRDQGEAYDTFVSPCICLVGLGAQSVSFDALRLVPDEDNDARFSGTVGGPIRVSRHQVAASCDSIAEVNALVDSSQTAGAIYRNALEGITNLHRELHGQSFPDDNADEIEEIRAFTLLNNSGDSTITWEKENDEVMRDLIEKKMKQGVAFFVIPPKVMGFIPRPKSRVTDVDEIMKRRSVSVKDEDFAAIIASGLADITDRPEIDTERAVQCHDPAVIARSQSIGVMPMRGG